MALFRHATILLCASLTTLTGCGKDDAGGDPGPGFVDDASAASGLVFTVTDSSYTSSRLLYNDLKTGDLRTVLSAESGDPALFWLGTELIFFNRTTDRRNFKRLDPRNPNPQLSAELATPLAGVGDPSDLLPLTGDQVMLAHRDAGVVFVMDVKTGAVVQKIEADWDFDGKANAQLRPVSLLAWDATTTYLLHQGKGNDSMQTLNGTQQVFVLKLGADGQWSVVDQNDAKAKIQGIKLPISNPAHLLKDVETLTVNGTCTLWDKTCTSGFADIDTTAKTATMLFDTSALKLKGNGRMVPTGSGHFYGATVRDTGDPMNPGEKTITRFFPDNQTADQVFMFPAGSPGCCGLYFDKSSLALWIGDSTTSGTGSFSIYKDDTLAGTLELDALPYDGLFISP